MFSNGKCYSLPSDEKYNGQSMAFGERGLDLESWGEVVFFSRFFYKMDLERVIKGSLWTFNSHLLMLHRLMRGEDQMKVPLIYMSYWVQIHEVPIGFFNESLARQLRDFLRKFIEYDGMNLERGLQMYLRVKVIFIVRRLLKRKKKVLFSFRISSYVSFKYEHLTMFCFFCGCLGYNDSFCQAKMALGYEVAEMRWDLSLGAQSRRALCSE